jgi:Ca2+ regulator and membrane fusion protein Fig1
MLVIVVCLGLFTTFPGWELSVNETGSEHEIKPFPSRTITYLIAILLGFATIFSFVSVLWMHSAAATAVVLLNATYHAFVDAKIGTTAMILAWIALFCTAVVLMLLLLTITSIEFIDEIMEDN